MKRLTVFFVLALTLALMAALTSCGCGASVQDGGGNTTNGSDTGTTNGSTNSGSTNGNTGSGPNSGTGSGTANGSPGSNTAPGNDSVMDNIIQGGEDIVGGVDDAIDDITGSGTHDGGVTYGDMLQDGTVKDHDGTLGNESTARRR